MAKVVMFYYGGRGGGFPPRWGEDECGMDKKYNDREWCGNLKMVVQLRLVATSFGSGGRRCFSDNLFVFCMFFRRKRHVHFFHTLFLTIIWVEQIFASFNRGCDFSARGVRFFGNRTQGGR